MKGWPDGNIPLVSVCCITYNHEKYINDAIDGFLMQETTFPFEIIIRDDCSSDNTASIIRKYAGKYPNIIKPIYEKENRYSKGVKAMPVVYEKAAGKYLALCEGDDYWNDTSKLERQVALLEKNAVSAGCFHESKSIMLNGKEGRVFGEYQKRMLTTVDTIARLSPLHTSSFMFRRSLLPDPIPDWYEKVVSGDMALFMIMASKGPLFSIPEIMSVYRKHAGSITENPVLINGIHEHRITLLKYFDAYTDHEYHEIICKIIDEHKKELTGNRKNKRTFSVRKLLSNILRR
jgi:glycosyltransferase involved in cell wall biosynthesis